MRVLAPVAALMLLVGCAHPNITLAQAARVPVPLEQVAVLTEHPPAETYQVLGVAYAWSGLPVDSRKGYARAVESLRQRAASVGATAILVPPPERIEDADIQDEWMERRAGMVHYANDVTDYVRPQELKGVLLVKSP